ncbi:unnamed protein product [Brachionus calyciflorus]|uniref:Uncharacterized protein n=1 Tax=Brachionus calyciflorus TaxID=104777 RepID=A0A814NEB8_9BILA|nr:unnamed protein product [Brachionus calyciflorus]
MERGAEVKPVLMFINSCVDQSEKIVRSALGRQQTPTPSPNHLVVPSVGRNATPVLERSRLERILEYNSPNPGMIVYNSPNSTRPNETPNRRLNFEEEIEVNEQSHRGIRNCGFCGVQARITVTKRNRILCVTM